ncbi:MAG: hypothetical protein ACLQF2_09545 [Rhodomicrobium sp.]
MLKKWIPVFERVKKSIWVSTVLAGLDPAIQNIIEMSRFFSRMGRSSRAMTPEFAANARIFHTLLRGHDARATAISP